MSMKTSYKPRKKNELFSRHYQKFNYSVVITFPTPPSPSQIFIRIKKTIINTCSFSQIVRVHYNFIITQITDIRMHTMNHIFTFNLNDMKVLFLCYETKCRVWFSMLTRLAVFASHQIVFRNMESLVPYSKFPYLRFSKSTCMYMKPW